MERERLDGTQCLSRDQGLTPPLEVDGERTVKWVNGERDEVPRLSHCLHALLLLPHDSLTLFYLLP